MKRSNRLLILIGMLLAVGAVVGVIAFAGNKTNTGGGGTVSGGSPSPTAEPLVPVVVAKVDIPFGTKIDTSMLTTVQKPLSAVNALGGDTYSDPALVSGKVAGGLIKKGEILYADKSFMLPGSFTKGQDLASAVDPGMVGVSMEVDQVNGVGALLVPGDHVDVILSVWVPMIGLDVKDSNGTSVKVAQNNDVTTKMVIQNAKVLVTLLPPPEAQQGGSSNASPTPVARPTTQAITNNGQHMIVVIQVSPGDAEVIRWAQREEKQDPQNYITLGLALRSDKDNGAAPVTTGGITFKQLVAQYGVLPADPRAYIPPDLVRLITF